jgi:hypothetical protein
MHSCQAWTNTTTQLPQQPGSKQDLLHSVRLLPHRRPRQARLRRLRHHHRPHQGAHQQRYRGPFLSLFPLLSTHPRAPFHITWQPHTDTHYLRRRENLPNRARQRHLHAPVHFRSRQLRHRRRALRPRRRRCHRHEDRTRREVDTRRRQSFHDGEGGEVQGGEEGVFHGYHAEDGDGEGAETSGCCCDAGEGGEGEVVSGLGEVVRAMCGSLMCWSDIIESIR